MIFGSRPGGPRILKRINIYGGLTKFKKKYYAYFRELKDDSTLNFFNYLFNKTITEIDLDKLIELKEYF